MLDRRNGRWCFDLKRKGTFKKEEEEARGNDESAVHLHSGEMREMFFLVCVCVCQVHEQENTLKTF